MYHKHRRHPRPKPQVAAKWPDKVTMRILCVLLFGGRLEFRDEVLHLSHPDYPPGWALGNESPDPAILADRGWLAVDDATETAVASNEGKRRCRIYLHELGISDRMLAGIKIVGSVTMTRAGAASGK